MKKDNDIFKEKFSIKNLLKAIGVWFLSFILAIGIVGNIEVIVTNIFKIKISAIISVSIYLFVPCLVGFIISILYYKNVNNPLKSTRVKNFIFYNGKKLLILFFVLAASYYSLRGEVFITRDNAKDFLSIQWMIFTITTALFIFLSSKVKEVFDKKETEIVDKNNGIGVEQLLQRIKEKEYLDLLIQNKHSIIMLIINLSLLTFFTITFYLYLSITGYVFQLIAVFSFYFGIQTLTEICVDILIPYIAEDIVKIQKYKKSAKEENTILYCSFLGEIIKKFIDELKNDNTLTNEQKVEILNQLQEKINKLPEKGPAEEKINEKK